MFPLRSVKEARHIELSKVVAKVNTLLTQNNEHIITPEIQSIIESQESISPDFYETQYWSKPPKVNEDFMFVLSKTAKMEFSATKHHFDQVRYDVGIDLVDVVRVGYETAMTIIENQVINNNNDDDEHDKKLKKLERLSLTLLQNSDGLSNLLFVKLNEIKIAMLRRTESELQSSIETTSENLQQIINKSVNKSVDKSVNKSVDNDTKFISPIKYVLQLLITFQHTQLVLNKIVVELEKALKSDSRSDSNHNRSKLSNLSVNDLPQEVLYLSPKELDDLKITISKKLQTNPSLTTQQNTLSFFLSFIAETVSDMTRAQQIVNFATYLQHISASVAMGTIWEIDDLIYNLFKNGDLALEVTSAEHFNFLYVKIGLGGIGEGISNRVIVGADKSMPWIHASPQYRNTMVYYGPWTSLFKRRLVIAKHRVLLLLRMHKSFKGMFRVAEAEAGIVPGPVEVGTVSTVGTVGTIGTIGAKVVAENNEDVEGNEDKDNEQEEYEKYEKSEQSKKDKLKHLNLIKSKVTDYFNQKQIDGKHNRQSRGPPDYFFYRNPWSLVTPALDDIYASTGYKIIDNYEETDFNSPDNFNGNAPFIVILRNGDFQGALFFVRDAKDPDMLYNGSFYETLYKTMLSAELSTLTLPMKYTDQSQLVFESNFPVKDNKFNIHVNFDQCYWELNTDFTAIQSLPSAKTVKSAQAQLSTQAQSSAQVQSQLLQSQSDKEKESKTQQLQATALTALTAAISRQGFIFETLKIIQPSLLCLFAVNKIFQIYSDSKLNQKSHVALQNRRNCRFQALAQKILGELATSFKNDKDRTKGNKAYDEQMQRLELMKTYDIGDQVFNEFSDFILFFDRVLQFPSNRIGFKIF